MRLAGRQPRRAELEGARHLPRRTAAVWHPARHSIEDLENAVAKLPPEDLVRFRAWFEEFDAARFDQKIERDAKSGKLDRLADQALDDFRKGRAREL
jgi:hypothetical protein